MWPLLHRFHAVKTTQSHLLFARINPPHLNIVFADTTYNAQIGHGPEIPSATIRGSMQPLSFKLLSLLLSTPATVASIVADDTQLQLDCLDRSSLHLILNIPIACTASKSVLHELHESLVTVAASLEACLLAAGRDDLHVEQSNDIQGLRALHAAPMHNGQILEQDMAFRRMTGSKIHLLAARAFAAGQAATNARRDILRKRHIRFEREQRKRERDRNSLRKSKQLAMRPKAQPSFFLYKPPLEEKQENGKDTESARTSAEQNDGFKSLLPSVPIRDTGGEDMRESNIQLDRKETKKPHDEQREDIDTKRSAIYNTNEPSNTDPVASITHGEKGPSQDATIKSDSKAPVSSITTRRGTAQRQKRRKTMRLV